MNKLKQFMKDRELSQIDAAALLGVSRQTISKHLSLDEVSQAMAERLTSANSELSAQQINNHVDAIHELTSVLTGGPK